MYRWSCRRYMDLSYDFTLDWCGEGPLLKQGG
jgi:hypothetical protein